MGTEARQEALAKRSLENGNRMSELAATSSRVATQHEAHMSLYNVAAQTGDEETMKKEREILHNLLDELLDVGSQIGVGMRAAQAIAKEFYQL
jgi:hypothetical protein